MTQQIHIVSKSYRMPQEPKYVVRVDDGEDYYRIGGYVLDRLYEGATPEELELDPYVEDDEEGE